MERRMARFIQGDRPEARAELAMTGWELTKGRIFSHRIGTRRRFFAAFRTRPRPARHGAGVAPIDAVRAGLARTG